METKLNDLNNSSSESDPLLRSTGIIYKVSNYMTNVDYLL